MKKGFTLIEILVVVLIIGILAAVALPQYQLAVDKSDFARYQSMVASLRDSYDEHVVLYGEGTRKFEELSVDLPDDFTSSYDYGAFICKENEDMFCCMSGSGDQHGGLVNCGKSDLSVLCSQNFFGIGSTVALRKMYCLAQVNNKRANRLCGNIGKFTGTGNNWTPEGYKNSYNYYVLP